MPYQSNLQKPGNNYCGLIAFIQRSFLVIAGVIKKLIKEVLINLNIFYWLKDLFFYNDPIHQQQYEFYRSFISKQDLVFDVGGNIGERARIFADLANMAVVIEPQPFCLRHLRSRYKFVKNVVIEPVGMAQKKGEIEMYLSQSHTLASMSQDFVRNVAQSIFKDENWNETISVKTATIDYLILKYGKPKFIKIDVEGFEYNVLSGLSEPIDYLSFEYIPSNWEQAIKCLKYLHHLNSAYKYNFTLGEKLNFQLSKHIPYSEIINCTGLSSANTFGDIYAINEP